MPIHVDCVEARELMKATAFATILVSLSESCVQSDKTWGRANDLHSQMDTEIDNSNNFLDGEDSEVEF